MEEGEYTLLETFFGRHSRNVSDRLGADKAKAYAKAVNSRLQSVQWLTGASLLTLLVSLLAVDMLDEENLSNLLILGVATIIYAVFHLFSIRKVGSETMFDAELSSLWRNISTGAAVFGVLCGSVCLCIMTATYDISFTFSSDSNSSSSSSSEQHAYDVRFDDLGIVVNVPEGWSSPNWEYKSACIKISLPCDEDDIVWNVRTRSKYKFDVPAHGYNVRFDLQVVYTSENAGIQEYEESFVEIMNKKLNDGFVKAPGLVKIGGMDALYVAGYEKTAPDKCYIRYEFIHKGARPCVVASVPKSSGVTEQIDHIENIMKDIKFY